MREELTPEEELLLEFALVKEVVPTDPYPVIEEKFKEKIANLVKDTSLPIYRRLLEKDVATELLGIFKKHLKDFRTYTTDAKYIKELVPHLVVLPKDFPRDVEEKLLYLREVGDERYHWCCFFSEVVKGYYALRAFNRSVSLSPVKLAICDVLRSSYPTSHVVRPHENIREAEYFRGAVGYIEYVILLKHIRNVTVAVGHLDYKGRKIREVDLTIVPDKTEARKEWLIQDACNAMHDILEGTAYFLDECKRECLQRVIEKMDASLVRHAFSPEFETLLRNLFSLEEGYYVFDYIPYTDAREEKFLKNVHSLYFLVKELTPAFIEWDFNLNCATVCLLPKGGEEFLKLLLYDHAYWLLDQEIGSISGESYDNLASEWSLLVSEALAKKKLCVGSAKAYLCACLFFNEIVK